MAWWPSEEVWEGDVLGEREQLEERDGASLAEVPSPRPERVPARSQAPGLLWREA